MNDMSSVIVPKSDQLNSDTLISGPITIQITDVEIRPGTEQPVTIHYDGERGQPWRPCKSMSRVLVAAWGPDAKKYVGRSVTLYRDPAVKWGGMEVGGIRVSHMSDLERDMVLALTATKGKRAPFIVKQLVQQRQAETEPLFTLAMAKADLEAAADLTELETLWKRKIMSPLRASLRDVLEQRKEALTPVDAEDPFEPQTGRADADHGDQHPGEGA